MLRTAKDLVKNTVNKTFRNYGKINYKGQGVINYIDVGSIGELPSPWHENAPLINKALMFEPQDSQGKTEHVITLDKAVWSKNETRDFYIYKGFNSTGSSLYEQNFDYVDANFDTLKQKGPRKFAESWHDRSQLVKTIQMECTTLDEVLKGIPETFHFLKIDAQGAEYEILKGADGFLNTDCVGLHLELFNVPLYKGIKLLPEVVDYLKKKNFTLIKKFKNHGTFDSQNDCVFIKNTVDADMKRLIEKIYSLN